MTDGRRMADMAPDTAQTPPASGEGAATPRPRIDPVTRLLVLRLKEAEPDRSAASIASVVGNISEASVRRLLAGHTTDTKALTKQLMALTVADRLENWERACEVAAEKGYHQPAKDYLEAAGNIEPKPTATVQVDARPTVMISMPFQLGAVPAQPQPAIEAEAQPVPQLPPAEGA